ncbi:uncharacterized protein METZ01_LOCUS208251 [marine metagenome]|uniref:Uncharacterized protein n=1 Tax=marine metagenome TaxID=408172 RepID=A0A382EZY9_9ZZZZ
MKKNKSHITSLEQSKRTQLLKLNIPIQNLLIYNNL